MPLEIPTPHLTFDVLLDAGARTDLVAYDGKLPMEIAVEEFGPDAPIVAELRRR